MTKVKTQGTRVSIPKSDAAMRFLKKSTVIRSQCTGPAVAWLLFLLAAVFAILGIPLPGYPGILGAVVVYTALRSGLMISLIAVVPTIAYYLLYYPSTGILISNHNDSWVGSILTICGLFLIVYFISQAIRTITFERNELEKSRAERMEAENALVESEGRLRRITDNMLDMISQTDAAGCFEYVSPSHEAFLGYTQESLIGKCCLEYVHPEDLAYVRSSFHISLEYRLPQTIQYRYRCADGSYIWLETTGSCLSEGDKVTGAIFCSRDVSKRKSIEDALRISELKYRTLFDNVKEGVLLHKIDENGLPGRIVEVNSVMSSLSGYSRDELLKMTPMEMDAHQETSLDPQVMNTFLTRQYIAMERNLLTKNKCMVPVEINSHPLQLNGEQYVVSMIRDITEQKKAENSIRQSEQLLRSILDNLPIGVWVADADLRMVFWNQYLERATNIKREEVIGRHAFEQFPATDDTDLEQLTRDVFMSRKSILVDSLPIYPPGDKSRLRYINLRAIPLKDENDSINGIIVTSEDMTAQKLSEQALRESEERYRMLVECMPDAMFVLRDDRVLYANKAAGALLSLSSVEELIGKHLREIVHPLTLEEASRVFCSTPYKYDSTVFMELNVSLIDGTILDIEFITSPVVYYDGKPAGMFIVRDAGEKRRTEELRRRMAENTMLLNQTLELDKLKTDFLANLSHELRTPLNVILSTIQLAQLNFGKNPEAEMEHRMFRHMATIRQNCFRLLRLVNNLIDITKIDAGFFEVEMQNCNIVSIVEDIALSVADYVSNKGILLEFDTDREEIYTACDPDAIERILLNLLANAVKFTEAGGNIWVHVKYRRGRVCISVRDTGIGIPQDKQEMVFERFRQVNGSLTRNHEGSGIGLSLVKALVEMHEGSISVVSETGRGSEFSVELPLKDMEGQSPKQIGNRMNQGVVERINIEFSDIYSLRA